MTSYLTERFGQLKFPASSTERFRWDQPPGSRESSMKRASPTSTGKLASDRWRHDLLADLLGSIRLRSAVFFPMELDAPWGFSLSARAAAFRIIARGPCWLEVAGVGQSNQLVGGVGGKFSGEEGPVDADGPPTQIAEKCDCRR